MFLVILFIKIW